MEAACSMLNALLKTNVKEQRTPFHPIVVKICDVLQREGVIRGFRVEEGKVRILLKHYQGAPVIRNVRVVSKPMRDIWVTPHELKYRTQNNTGLWIVQTPFGIVSHRRCIEMGLGGRTISSIGWVGHEKKK